MELFEVLVEEIRFMKGLGKKDLVMLWPLEGTLEVVFTPEGIQKE